MMNFIKGYDWVLLGTVFIGGLAALIIYNQGKKALDKKAMDTAKIEAS